MVILISTGTALSYNDGHSLVTGRVTDISEGFIEIDDEQYVLSPKCKVKIEYKVDNAFYLKPAKIRDLNRGYSVIAVKIANTVTELTIEGWKR